MQVTGERTAVSDGEATAPAPYNYQKFRTGHFLYDLQATKEGRGIQPGEMAPEFRLADSRGGTVSLDDFRGKPLVLHFGSPT